MEKKEERQIKVWTRDSVHDTYGQASTRRDVLMGGPKAERPKAIRIRYREGGRYTIKVWTGETQAAPRAKSTGV